MDPLNVSTSTSTASTATDANVNTQVVDTSASQSSQSSQTAQVRAETGTGAETQTQTSTPVVVPNGTQEAVRAIFADGAKPEAIEAFLAKHDPAVAEKLKAMFEGDESIAFDEAAPDLSEFSELTEEEIGALPAELQVKVKGYIKALEEAVSMPEPTPVIPEEVKLLEQDPVFALRLNQLKSGSLDVKVPTFDEALTSAGVDVEKAFALIQDMFETEGREPEAINLMRQAFAIAAKQVNVMTEADVVTREEVKRNEAVRQTEETNFYKGELTKIGQTIPEFKGVSLYEVQPDGKLKLTAPEGTPAKEFLDWAVQMNTPDEAGAQVISDAYIKQFGLEGVYQQWKISKAGSVGRFMGEQKLSLFQQAQQRLRGDKNDRLKNIAAKTPSISSEGQGIIIVHGVDIARAVADKSGKYLMSMGLNSKAEDEVVNAMMKFEISRSK